MVDHLDQLTLVGGAAYLVAVEREDDDGGLLV